MQSRNEWKKFDEAADRARARVRAIAAAVLLALVGGMIFESAFPNLVRPLIAAVASVPR